MLMHVLCLTGRTRSFSLDLYLAGVALARLDKSDYDAMTAARDMELASRALHHAKAGPLARVLLGVTYTARDAARYALPAGIFFLSFMQWWYASGHASAASATPVVPPPQPPHPHPDGLRLPTDPRLCPLCRRLRTNPAAIASSGLLFCYPCAFGYVDKHRRCPVTHLPADTTMLVRVHD